MQTHTTYQAAALLALRVVLAAMFFVAGYAKGFIWTGETFGMSAWLVPVTQLLSVVEPLGALVVLAGFLTRWAAAGLSIIMVGAIFVTQFEMGMGFVTPTGPGWSYPLLTLAGCLVLLAFGPGQWSVDEMRQKRAQSTG